MEKMQLSRIKLIIRDAQFLLQIEKSAKKCLRIALHERSPSRSLKIWYGYIKDYIKGTKKIDDLAQEDFVELSQQEQIDLDRELLRQKLEANRQRALRAGKELSPYWH